MQRVLRRQDEKKPTSNCHWSVVEERIEKKNKPIETNLYNFKRRRALVS